MRSDKHRHKSGLLLTIVKNVFITGLLIGSVVGGGYLGTMLFNTKDTFKNIYQPSEATTQNKIQTLKENNLDNQLSILLLGVDNDEKRGLDTTRADSIIYMVYDGKNNKLEMVSLPRDIWTNIYDGKGNIVAEAKINSGYIYNEEESMIETVKNYLELPVDYYARVNFLSFEKIIDTIGGIEVDVPYDINKNFTTDNSGETIIPAGRQKLTGKQALIFSRIRKMDDDIARGNRQQEVIKATIKQTLNINNVTKYQELLDAVSSDVRTNLKFEEMTMLASGMLQGFEINTNTFEWQPYDVAGQSAVLVPEESRQEIKRKMQQALGL